MNSSLALVFSFTNEITFLVQVLVATFYILIDSYFMLYAILGVIVIDGLGLIYFMLQDNHQSNLKVNYWIWCFFQLEFMHIFIHNQIPMSTLMNTGYRAFKELLYVIVNLVFVFTLQFNENETNYNIQINQLFLLFSRLFIFSMFLYAYNTIKYQTAISFGQFLEAPIMIYAYYLTLGILSTIEIQIKGQKFNLALLALMLIITTNWISMLYNFRQIRDNQNQNLFNTFLCSIACNSYYRQLCSYGVKKPTIVLSFLNWLAMISGLIFFSAEDVYDDLFNFLHLPLKRKFVVACSIITIILGTYYILGYLFEFFLYTFQEKSYYINSDDDLLSSSKEFKSRMIITQQVDIVLNQNYQPSQGRRELQIEERKLIESKCQDAGCHLKFHFLKSISNLLRQGISVNIEQQHLQLCKFHTEELLSQDEQVYKDFLNDILTQEIDNKNQFLFTILQERFTNGFYQTKVSEAIKDKLTQEEQDILKHMNTQAYQIYAFLNHQKQEITILPGLLLFDLYSIDT